jgi:phage baseplate assembly protein gpV
LMLATTIHESNTTPHHQDGATPDSCHPPSPGEQPLLPVSQGDEEEAGLLPQSPTACLAAPTSRRHQTTPTRGGL